MEALREASPAAEEDEELAALGEAFLWGAGCAGLGGGDRRLLRLQEALEDATPAEVLECAREAVERECGPEAAGADADDLNWDWALRRIATRAQKAMDPGQIIVAQVWHELVRVHLSARGTEERSTLPGESKETAEDASMLFWLQRSEEEARQSAKALPQERLKREVERLMDYSARAMLLGSRLRELVEGWTRFDAYRVLGVRKGASRSEVRRAFYRKALLMHPDKGGDKAAFQELQQAYDEVLRLLDEGGGEAEEGQEEQEGGQQMPSPTRSSEASPKAAKSPRCAPWAPGAGAAPGNEDADSPAGEEGDAEAWEGAELAEEEQKRLAALSRSASAAAEGARALAERALRCALAGQEALEQEPVEWDAAHEQTEAALSAARELTEASRQVAQFTARAAGLLSRCIDASHSRHADHSIDGAAAVSAAVELSVRVCLKAVGEAAAALRRSVAEYEGEDLDCDDSMDDSGCFVSRLDSAISMLVEAIRRLSVAASDAAETVAEAVLAVGVPLREDEDLDASLDLSEAGTPMASAAGERTVLGQSFEDGEEAGSEAETGEKEEERAKRAEEEEEERALRRLLEARQQLSALLEAVRMFKRTNQELSRLQRAARQAAADSQADQRQKHAAESRCRERAVALLAEFLDEAALGLQSGLCEVLGASSGECSPVSRCGDFGDDISSAIEDNFGFVTRCAPELAMPQDPRMQALRAAMVFESEGVRNMLEAQVPQRLQASLMTVLLDAACDLGADTQGPRLLEGTGGAALDSLQAELLSAHERLAARLLAKEG